MSGDGAFHDPGANSGWSAVWCTSRCPVPFSDIQDSGTYAAGCASVAEAGFGSPEPCHRKEYHVRRNVVRLVAASGVVAATLELCSP